MQWIAILSGPVIGAIIGYFTNYIAVKMLFHPRNPISIGGHVLPFTPGIIPKRKADLGKAIGGAVAGELFGAEQVREILTEDNTKKLIVGGITDKMNAFFESEESLRELATGLVGRDPYEEKVCELGDFLTDKVVDGVASMEIGELMANHGGDVIRQSVANPLVLMFLTDEMIASVAYPIADEIVRYLHEDGREKIHDFIDRELDIMEETPVRALTARAGQLDELLAGKVDEVYDSFVEEHVDAIVGQFKIREIIEEKISAMSNEALEELVLSVMKNELGMIVNLGAVIGFVLGLLNIVI